MQIGGRGAGDPGGEWEGSEGGNGQETRGGEVVGCAWKTHTQTHTHTHTHTAPAAKYAFPTLFIGRAQLVSTTTTGAPLAAPSSRTYDI